MSWLWVWTLRLHYQEANPSCVFGQVIQPHGASVSSSVKWAQHISLLYRIIVRLNVCKVDRMLPETWSVICSYDASLKLWLAVKSWALRSPYISVCHSVSLELRNYTPLCFRFFINWMEILWTPVQWVIVKFKHLVFHIHNNFKLSNKI